MTMASWCHNVREAHRQLQRALKRARAEDLTSPGSPTTRSALSSSPTARRGARGSDLLGGSPHPSQDDPGAPEGDDQEDQDRDEEEDDAGEPPEAEPTWDEFFGKGSRDGGKGKDRSTRKRGTSTSSESSDGAQNIWQDLDTQLPPALPDELLGWIMLRRSGLNPTQRLNVLSAIQNSLKAEAVERGLRAAEEELRFMERDSGKGHGGGKGRGGRSFWVEQDGQWGILLSSEDIFEDITDQASIHWVEAPSHAPVEEAFTAELAVDPYIEQFWNHEDDGAYTLWKQDPMDGE